MRVIIEKDAWNDSGKVIVQDDEYNTILEFIANTIEIKEKVYT